MTTWRDVVRVHQAHPKWTSSLIARSLGCTSAYVRATASRRKLKLPRMRRDKGHARAIVPLADVIPLCQKNETPHAALDRIVRDALAKAGAA